MPGQASIVNKPVREHHKPARTPAAEDAARPNTAPRTIRPRQLHVNDKIRIVVGNDDPEVARLDGGAFLEWLQRQDNEAEQGSSSGTNPSFQPRVAVIGHNFKPIPEHLEAPELGSLSKPIAAARREAGIATPSYINIQSNNAQEGAAAGRSAYIRYVVPTPDDEEATVEYDLDEEDEEWLQQHNHKTKQKMTEAEMEQLMDALEKMHHAELQKHPERWANLIGSPMPAKDSKGKGKALLDHSLHLPDVDTVLPLETALQGLASQQPAAMKAVHLHWCRKRQFCERPLLQRLWYEPPWHRLTVAGSLGKVQTDGESQDEVPFMAQEERRPLTRARKTMQLHDVDSKLRDMRDDLEEVRILADQCRRREKLRKRALATWQQHMHGLLQQAITLDHQLLGTPHASPAAKKSAAAKLAAEQTGHRQSGSSRGSHGKVANSKQAQQLAAEIADATENAQAKFEHDMALSLQLTKAVAEEAAKLHHVKIVRAESSQAEEAAAGAGPSEAKGSGHPRLTPTDPIPAAQLEASPGRLTQSKQAQATPPGPTSDPVGRESASAPLPQSAPQQGSSAATTLSRECDRQINAGTGPQLGLGQGSPSEAPGPALSQAALGDAISPRRSSRQRAGEMGQTAEAAAAEVEFSAQRMTRSMQASVSSRTDDVTPAASRQAGVHPTSLSHMHRQTRSTQAQSKSLDSNKSHGEEEEQAGQAYLAAPLEVELHSSQLPSSSSCERRGRSAQLRSSTQHTVTTASPQTETASGDEHQDTLQTSPRQTRSLRVQPPLVSSRQGVKAGLSSLDPKTLAPSISPQAKAQQSDIARLTRSPAGNYKSTTAPQGSRSKKSRAGSTSKSVRFSLGVSVPEDNITAGAAAAAHELEPSCLDAQDSSVSDKMQPAAEASSKKTRSGKILGTGCATDRQPPAQPVPSPGSLVQQEVLPNTGRIRTTRSGRTFDAQPEPSTRSNTASVLSKRDHAVGSALVASARAAGTSSNSPATASASGNSPAPVRTSVNSPHPVGASSNSLATEPGPSQAAPAGSAGDRLCHPWKSSLLGVGSPLPQHDTLSDRGRPPITDHPCHKRKSASMTRRTLSPPLVSPRHPQPPSVHGAAQVNPGPSQLPSQLPQLHSTKTTVDRGCDPISFSDDSEDEEAVGSASLSRGRSLANSTKKLAVRSLTASKGKKRLLEELPAEASRRVTRHLATQAQRSDQASAAETDGEAPLRSETVSSRTANQSPAMHTPLDTAYGSATGNATPRMRAVTRAAAAAGISLPEAAAAAGRAGVTPAGKPPLPPTASRTVSAYRSAHRQRTGPIAMGMPTVKTRASSPGLGAPASFPPSSPTSSLAAAAAADESTGRPVTRRSAQQQGLTNPPGTQPSGGARDAETVPTPTARGRDKRAAAEVGPDQAGNDHCSPGSASGNLTLERRTQPAVRGKLGGVSKKRRAEVSLAVLESQGRASQQAQTVAGKPTLLAKPQRTHSQYSSKTAADRVTRKLVHSARASSRQGTSALPAAAIAAASALKQASASGKLGCPKCRQAVYGCKKCRAAYVKTTGVSIPVDRSLHAGVFNGLQRQSASTHSTALTGQLVAGQKPSSAHTDGSGLQGKAGQSTGKATPADKGKAVVAVAPKGHKGIADRGRPLASGRRASADRETPSHDRQGSAKRARSESPVPQPARKKQKPSSLSAVTAAAAASMGARVCGKVAPGTRRSRSAVSPGVSKAHADSDPPQAAERSRLSQNPKAPPAAKQAPDSKASTAAKGPASKLSTAAKACTVSGSKPSSSAKGARPSSSSGRAGLATVKQHGKAGRLSVPSALARSASKHQCVSAKPRVAALPKQAAPTPTQVHKPTTLLPRSHTRGLSPFIKKAPTSAPAPALPKQAAATAPAKSTVRSVGAPKAMPAAKIRRSPASTAAATAGSVLGRGLDSNLGCSKCRFVPSGCKRCRAKQAGRLSLGTNA